MNVTAVAYLRDGLDLCHPLAVVFVLGQILVPDEESGGACIERIKLVHLLIKVM